MQRDFIALGASAGGVQAIINVVAALPDDLEASVGVVLHLPRAAVSVLATVVQRYTQLPTSHARDGDVLKRGHIYVAPPDCHLLVEGETFRLGRGPRMHGHRPAIDALFQSAAAHLGPRVIGVVLSGALDDGARGLRAIVELGGLGVVQDPADAAFPDMPTHALALVPDAVRAPVHELGALLGAMSRPTSPEGRGHAARSHSSAST